MRAAFLSVAAAVALAVSAGAADARPPAYHGGHHAYYGGHHGYYGGYGGGYRGGFYRPAYYPSYDGGYGYTSGFGLSIGGPQLGITLGSGGVYPYSGFGGCYSPYSGGYYSPWGW